jgi:hypothetical protein
MPCERKHVEAIRNSVDAVYPFLCGHGVSIPEVYEAIDAAIKACDQSPWRGMESAPKDGKYIIITQGSMLPDIAVWHSERPARGDRLAIPEGWFAAAGRSRVMFPTHWMPLPEAPRKEVRDDDA